MSANELALLRLGYRNACDERDALAQRCRELEHMLKHARMDADTHYADTLTLRAEVERLRQALRSVIVAAGGVAEPGVSAEFLEQTPLEVAELKRERAQLDRQFDIYREQAWELVQLRSERELLAEILGAPAPERA